MHDDGFVYTEDRYDAIERKNLIQLLKLSVKYFIDHALSLSSGLEEEDPSLYQFFVVIEKVLSIAVYYSVNFKGYIYWNVEVIPVSEANDLTYIYRLSYGNCFSSLYF